MLPRKPSPESGSGLKLSKLCNVLAAAARSGHGISEAQLHNYVDTWVGMLTAPVSYETRALMAGDGN